MNVRDFPVMVSTRLVTIIFGFLATIILIRGLSQTDYGTFIFWISVLSFTKMVSDGALSPFSKYLLPQVEEARLGATVKTGLLIKLGTGILSGLVLIGYFSVRHSEDAWLLFGIFAAFILVTVFDYLIGVLTGLKSFDGIAVAEVANSVSKLVLYAAIIAIAAGPAYVLGGYALAYAFGLVIALIVTLMKIDQAADTYLDARYDYLWREFRTFAPYQFLNSLVKTTGGPVLVWILITLLNPVAVAQWSAILQIQRLLMRLLHPVREVLFPEFSDSTGGERATITAHYIKVCLIILLPISVGGMILAPHLLETAFGAEYRDAAPAMSAIIWSSLFGALSGLPYFTGQGRTRLGLVFSIFNRGLVLGLFTAGAFYDFYTAVYGYVFAVALSTFVLYWFIFSEDGTPALSKFAPLRTVLALTALAGVTIALEPYLTGPVALIGTILAIGIGYFLLVFRLGVITASEKRLLLEAFPFERGRGLLTLIIRTQ